MVGCLFVWIVCFGVLIAFDLRLPVLLIVMVYMVYICVCIISLNLIIVVLLICLLLICGCFSVGLLSVTCCLC